jgi:hypothetical protein
VCGSRTPLAAHGMFFYFFNVNWEGKVYPSSLYREEEYFAHGKPKVVFQNV